jgi:primary-amine oxidase
MSRYDHPLDPLSAAEIERAVAIVRAQAGLDASAWFETVTLHEPDKAYVRGFTAGDALWRKAFVCCYEPASNRTFDGVVDIAAGRLERWQHVPGAQARIVADEFLEGERIAKADPAFRAACAKRGITDMARVLMEPWSAGNFGIAEEAGQRIAYGNCWLGSGDNPYAWPIANLHPVIDLRARRLLRIDDWGVVPLPPEASHIGVPEVRADLKPLTITQPEGPSFAVEGRLVRWQNWRFRVGFAVRDGLVLHEIGYEDGGRVRPIMYRASLAEMVVPYGDPTATTARTPSTPANTASGNIWIRSPSAATASATSTISTPGCMTGTASRSRSPTRSACTRRTTASSGSSPIGRGATRRCGARAGS